MNKKIYEIDFDSLDDCMKLVNAMKSRIGELRANKNGTKREKFLKVFDACKAIYDTDISEVYNNLHLNEEKIYYVYAHCHPLENIAVKKDGRTTFLASLGLDKIPFYIGKGTGNRAFDLNRNETHRKVRQSIKAFGKDVFVKIIHEGLTEKEALMYESKLIDIIGLNGKGGKLVNLDEGVNSGKRQELYIDYLKDVNLFYKNSL